MKLTEEMERKMANEASQMYSYLSANTDLKGEAMAEELAKHLGTSDWEYKGFSTKTIKCKPYNKTLDFLNKTHTICIDSKPIATLGLVGEKIGKSLYYCLRYNNPCIYEFDMLHKRVLDSGFISIDCEDGQIMLLCDKTESGDKFADWVIERLRNIQ